MRSERFNPAVARGHRDDIDRQVCHDAAHQERDKKHRCAVAKLVWSTWNVTSLDNFGIVQLHEVRNTTFFGFGCHLTIVIVGHRLDNIIVRLRWTHVEYTTVHAQANAKVAQPEGNRDYVEDTHTPHRIVESHTNIRAH